MTNLPPEVATARALLRRTAPLPGSKGRIYRRVVAHQPHHVRTGMRAATVAFCVAASTSAMALGYRWVTQGVPAVLHTEVQPQTSPLASQVPRRHKIGNPAHQAVDTREITTALPTAVVPVATSSSSRSVATANNASHVGLRSVITMDTNGVVSPAAPTLVAESELSQQVRDYRDAMAAMRTDPNLALEKLLTYRSKWRRSAIAQEVDLRVIEALTALGRHHEAANAARAFVQSYPDSAHLGQMRRIADATTVPND